MVKGQAARMALTNGAWQDICIAREIVRSVCTEDSVTSAVREWAECKARLASRASLLEAVRFYLSNQSDGGPVKPTRFTDAAPAYHEHKVKSGKSPSHC